MGPGSGGAGRTVSELGLDRRVGEHLDRAGKGGADRARPWRGAGRGSAPARDTRRLATRQPGSDGSSSRPATCASISLARCRLKSRLSRYSGSTSSSVVSIHRRASSERSRSAEPRAGRAAQGDGVAQAGRRATPERGVRARPGITDGKQAGSDRFGAVARDVPPASVVDCRHHVDAGDRLALQPVSDRPDRLLITRVQTSGLRAARAGRSPPPRRNRCPTCRGRRGNRHDRDRVVVLEWRAQRRRHRPDGGPRRWRRWFANPVSLAPLLCWSTERQSPRASTAGGYAGHWRRRRGRHVSRRHQRCSLRRRTASCPPRLPSLASNRRTAVPRRTSTPVWASTIRASVASTIGRRPVTTSNRSSPGLRPTGDRRRQLGESVDAQLHRPLRGQQSRRAAQHRAARGTSGGSHEAAGTG